MMSIFKKKTPPQGHKSDENVATESSVCTGETLIGFKNPQTGKLEKAEFVRCQEDINEFYLKYDLINSGRIKWNRK